MITITQLLEAFQAKLATDIDFLAWCNTNLAMAPIIQIGEDAQNPLGAEDAPAIILHGGAPSSIGQEEGQHSISLGIDWIVVDEAVITTGTRRTYAGVLESDAFGEQIWQTLQKVSPNIALSRAAYAIDPVVTYPLFSGGMDIDVQVPNVIGHTIEL